MRRGWGSSRWTVAGAAKLSPLTVGTRRPDHRGGRTPSPGSGDLFGAMWMDCRVPSEKGPHERFGTGPSQLATVRRVTRSATSRQTRRRGGAHRRRCCPRTTPGGAGAWTVALNVCDPWRRGSRAYRVRCAVGAAGLTTQ
eukprot:5824695-Prymnesium_polylepis.2